jgi:nucleotide-binding universal stress UspA family protein
MARTSTRTRRQFRVLIATDGSPSARAALRTAAAFPWPEGTRVRAVVASPPDSVAGHPAYVRIALARSFERVAARARRQLQRTWPHAEVTVVDEAPAEAILGAARRFGATVIVLGWRGHGTVRRLLMGSVSRRVVERARGPVLVVRRAARRIRRVVVAVDGSPNARRAVEFAARLRPDRSRSVTVVRVVEPIAVPTVGLLPAGVRGALAHSAAMLNRQMVRRARRDVDAAVARLTRAGARARGLVRSGIPLNELLDVVAGCDLVVLGARGTRGLRGVLLGSVAAGTLDRSTAPVLVVK